jgi:hypothetical protein
MVMAVGCPGIVLVVFAAALLLHLDRWVSTSVECIIAAAALVLILRIAAFRGWIYVYCAVWQHWCGGKRTEIMLRCFFLPALVHRKETNTLQEPCYLVTRYKMQQIFIKRCGFTS